MTVFPEIINFLVNFNKFQFAQFNFIEEEIFSFKQFCEIELMAFNLCDKA